MRRMPLALVLTGFAAVASVVAVGLASSRWAWPGTVGTSGALRDRPIAAAATAPIDVPLVGEGGAPASFATWRGQWLVVLFGYMTCPDVCPTSLAYLARELPQLGALAPTARGVFVSVDPARDTPARLGPYVRSFDPGFVALTGTEDSLHLAARRVGAYFEKQPDKAAPGGYLMAHTASLFILDPSGRVAGVVSPPYEPGALAAEIKRLAALPGAH